MGRKNSKSRKTERLPPTERTVVGSKVYQSSNRTANVPITARVYEPPQPFAQSLPTTRTSTAQSVQLDIDALRKILRHAGPLTLLTALHVSRAWRNAALEEVACTNRLHLSDAMQKFGQRTTPSSRWVIRTIEQFPCLKYITLSGLPYLERIPDLTTKVLTELSSATCTTLDLSKLDVIAPDICTLIRSPRMPSLSELILKDCSTVDASFTRLLVESLITSKRTLATIDVSNCAHIDASALLPLFTKGVINQVIAKRCINIRRISSYLPLTASQVNLHHCRNLVRFHVTSGALTHLNLSQCASLLSVHLKVAPNTPSTHQLQAINIASCHNLKDFNVDNDMPHLRELLLSRAKNLSVETFTRLQLDNSNRCSMPSLRRLELIDTQVRELRIKSWPQLECVDVSGCADLCVLEVSDCDQLSRLNASCRKAPLHQVDIATSKDTVLLGVRKNWSWSCNDRLQFVVYGTA